MAKRTYNRRGRTTAKKPVTSSARRQQRIKGAQTARKTGSKDKMTVSGQRNIKGGPRGAQGPANPPQQGPSRRVSGMIGSRTTPATKTKTQPPGTGKPPRFDPRIKTAAKVGTLVNPRSDLPAKAVAAASLAMDAVKALQNKAKPKPKKKPMASMGKNYKTQEKELSRKAVASNFDQAFAKARRAGKKTFTWRGKTYNTRLKK
jgi:hypothetical protein|tara:strand:+ start:478 stop:1086 length:609 start_codon:yes stop_codon:yes gene_type:complete